jgi:hypothetical protein
MTLMDVIAALILLCLGGLIVGAAVLSLFQRSRESSWRLLLQRVSALLVVYGGLAFFGQALAATGVLFFLGPSFEWPVGYAWGVVSDSAGRSIVPLTPSGRIQVYYPEDHFVCGWFVPAGGGNFKLHVTDEDQIEVFTGRGSRRFLFATDGTLLAQDTYPPGSYADLPSSPTTARVFTTSILLWPFSHPFIAWAVAVLGAIGFGLSDRKRHRKKSAP